MGKKIGIVSYFLIFLIIVPLLFYIIHTHTSTKLYSQVISFSDGKVLYDLPYPGIGPDHPLYLIKAVRDKLLDWTTRDLIKKAELYLLLSDKRYAMALDLMKKGKTKLALTTLSKGEKYFVRIPELLKSSKKQGVGYDSSLVYKLRLSNDKHKEIIINMSKDMPQGEEKEFIYLLDLNKQIKNQIDTL